MAHDTDIANRLRRRGLRVIEVNGWRTRGSSSFNPRGAVDHHTAGPRNGNAPSLGICTNGRADLPGPLCNVFIARDNTCFVVAAGRANHAGSGGWNGLSGNASVYGVERENVGTSDEPWRTDQQLTAGAVLAALIEGRADYSKVCLHREWAPSRKIDPHSTNGNDMRHLVRVIHDEWNGPKAIDWPAVRRYAAAVLRPQVASLPNLNGNHIGAEVKILQQALNLVTGSTLKVDGLYGKATILAVLNFQRFLNTIQPGSIKDFPGAAHEFTRWFMVVALNNIKEGK